MVLVEMKVLMMLIMWLMGCVMMWVVVWWCDDAGSFRAVVLLMA